jgi:CheY-like chemotaxis protein
VLIVDDLEINRSIFVRELAAAGLATAEAADGESALTAIAAAAADGRPFDIVLLDQMMPGLSGEAVAATLRARALAPRPKLVLVSSSGLSPVAGSGSVPLFDARLLKPIRRRVLLDCLAGLDGAAAPAAAQPPKPALEASAGGRILLAEDNAVNREVATTMLENFGYRVDIALDGQEAVRAAQAGCYSLILMDVEMPNLDGFEATRQIRALAGAVGRVPIVAMTANAMAGDRRRCVAAGMDDYVSKPINPPQFLATVARWIADPGGAAGAMPEPDLLADQPVLDEHHLAGLEKILSPDRFTIALDVYLQNAHTVMAQLRATVAADDLSGLKRIAHNLTSASGSFGARRLQGLAERLHAACEADDKTEARLLVRAILDASDQASGLLRTRSAAHIMHQKMGSTVH